MALIAHAQGNRTESRRLQRLAARGNLRRIHAGVYTDELHEPLESVVRRELYALCALLVSGGVISHRSALEMAPTSSGSFYLTAGYRRTITLPGLRLQISTGHGPAQGDIRIPTPMGEVHRASDARAYLENLTRARAGAAGRRTLSKPEVEDRLERLLAIHGERAINALRDEARRIAPALDLEAAMSELDVTIGRLLGTRRGAVSGPRAQARVRGMPYDAERVDLFDVLLAQLTQEPLHVPPAAKGDRQLQAFVESYFSNYIEGTEFELEEARRIVVDGAAIQYREDDSHDVLGTYRAILGSSVKARFPESFAAFEDKIKEWNRLVILRRLAKRPGYYKEERNRFGDTWFVEPELVRGTLEKGFERIMAASQPADRAAMAMLVVAEVHPFGDGNGRTARLTMNHALSAGARTRIIVPTVFREDYLLALKALSRDRNPVPYSRMLARAAAFSAWLRFGSEGECFAQLHKSNALKRANEARLRFETY